MKSTKRLQLAGLAIGIVAAVLLLAQALTPPRPVAPAAMPRGAAPPPDAPAAASRLTPEQQQAEERLLDEKSFHHPVSVPAPDVTVVGADGKPVRLAALRGKVVLVNFWATWCPPCVQEMPSMLGLAKELEAKHREGFRMVAVSGDESWDDVRAFFEKGFGGLPSYLEVVRDPDAAAARAYYCAARGYCPDVKFPETYVVDRSGRIVAMIVGPREWDGPEPRQLLERLIKG